MRLTCQCRFFIAVAALMGATAVMFGAYASHGLESWATAQQVSYIKLASQYQLIHALALLATSLLTLINPNRLLFACQLCLCLGVLCFSGSLYYLVFVGSKLLVMITPLGGMLLILAWLLMAFAMLWNRK